MFVAESACFKGARNSEVPVCLHLPLSIGLVRDLLGLKIATFIMHVLEVLFFTGLTGCLVVVILSWISVGGDAFSTKSDQ